MMKNNETIRIELVTDDRELRRKGHAHPVIELSNDYHCVWIPAGDVSYPTLEREIKRISPPQRETEGT